MSLDAVILDETTFLVKEVPVPVGPPEPPPPTDEVMIKNGLDPNDKVSHWGWYYPASNYIYAEERKKRSMTSVMNNIAKLIHHYERNTFPTKFFYKTCAHCSYFGICDAAQEDSWV